MHLSSCGPRVDRIPRSTSLLLSNYIVDIDENQTKKRQGSPPPKKAGQVDFNRCIVAPVNCVFLHSFCPEYLSRWCKFKSQHMYNNSNGS